MDRKDLAGSASFYFLSDPKARMVIRTVTLFVYFIIFQMLILLQKPFLQFDFIVIFYFSFGLLFAHHFFNHYSENKSYSKNLVIFSYLLDFLILILFMKNFPYLSSFILVLQLFFLFISSFDLDFFELCFLGFIASLGTSIINLSTNQSGSIQSILSLTLFNLSYLSVIIISKQLKSEFFNLQVDLSQTRRKWKSQEEFSRILIEKLPMGLVVTQNNQELVLQNSFFSQSLHLTAEGVQSLIRRYVETPARAYSKNIDLPYSEAGSDDDPRLYNFDQTQYFDEELDQNLDIYLIKDVTEQRVLENQLKQSEKLAAVGQLAAGIAHEIRNPLAGISGSIQMLSQEQNDPTQKKLMEIILKEIDRLNLLITEFLDYAKPEKAPDAEVSLKGILEEIVASFRQHPELPSGLQWSVRLNEVVILGFPEKLKQAFLNILLNSLQAMKNSEPARLEMTLENDEKQAILKIRDSGVGMTEATKKKIFEPFHTTKPKGTGLGLAITHKILEIHKAHIEVRSELNNGTEFIIKFPLAKGL